METKLNKMNDLSTILQITSDRVQTRTQASLPSPHLFFLIVLSEMNSIKRKAGVVDTF